MGIGWVDLRLQFDTKVSREGLQRYQHLYVKRVGMNRHWSPPPRLTTGHWRAPHCSVSLLPRLRKTSSTRGTCHSQYWLSTSLGGYYLYCLVTRWSRSARHTKQRHTPPSCEQMDHEEMGDITRSKEIAGGLFHLGSAVTKKRKLHFQKKDW